MLLGKLVNKVLDKLNLKKKEETKDEPFTNGSVAQQLTEGTEKGFFLATSFVAFILTQVIIITLGTFLWNNYLVPSVTFAKPLVGGVQLFGISILLQLLFV